jgi:hypothetical protein
MPSRSNLASALEAVAALDRDLSVAIEQAEVLAAHTYMDARNLWALRRSLERTIMNARGLREELLGVAGDESEHYHEVSLRERTAAIVVRLADLARAEYETEDEADQLYVGRFARLVEVSTHLLDRLGRLNEDCFRARVAVDTWRAPKASEGSDGHDAYRQALASANEQLTLIGHDPDLAHFLRAGAAVASEPFRAGCLAIASVLEVPIEVCRPS